MHPDREAYMATASSSSRRLTPERELDSYSRAPPPPPRHYHHQQQQHQQYGGNGGKTFLESRREQRAANSHITVWPPSPPPERSPSPDSSSRKRRHHRHRSSKHHRDGEHRSSKSSRRRRSRSPRSDSEQRDRRRSPHTHTRQDDEDEWVEKSAASTSSRALVPRHPQSARQEHGDSDDSEVGPQPASAANPDEFKQSYGGALLRGEGDAMAAFLASGQRIPRRGEIGMSADQIDRFENAGYVMSGSRHRRMNAVRVRKENQVISAEEKRSLLMMQKDEKTKRETEIVASFKELVDTKLNKR